MLLSDAARRCCSDLQDFGRKELLWQAVALSQDTEGWPSDNSCPNGSRLSKQIPPTGPAQRPVKNQAAISLSKPPRLGGWKDIKALFPSSLADPFPQKLLGKVDQLALTGLMLKIQAKKSHNFCHKTPQLSATAAFFSIINVFQH